MKLIPGNKRIERHQENLEKNTFVEEKGNCSKCAEVWCKYNITPTHILPNKQSMGDIETHHCSQYIRDKHIPNTVSSKEI